MILRGILIAAVATLAPGAASAGAAGDKPVAPPPAPAAVAQPAPAALAPFQFVTDFLGGKRSSQPPATADPLSILPPAAPRAAVDWAGSAFKAEPARRLALVPMPRLRPEYHAPIAMASGTGLEPAAIDIPPPAIDPSTTGAIAEPPEQAPPAPAAPEPAPVQTAAIPPPSSVVEQDGLLGDPTGFLAPTSTDGDPRLIAPSGVATPLPRGPAGAAGSATRAVGSSQPYELVRTLQSLQDQLAQGSSEAQNAQQALRALIERTFAAAGPEVWQDRRNDMAAVTYVLSGGAPAILRKLAALDPKPPIDPRLVTGVLAYAEGHEKEAGELLGPVDAIDLPASMGAQVAIAQSALVVRGDPQKAMHLLAIARLVAPGTLAEEAAIRRQIFIADQLKDDQTVQSLARQYLDRFRHSVYAGNFRARFAAALSHMDFINDEAQFPRLDDMLASVEPAARVQLYLTVALASATKGRTVAARISAERALALAAPGSADQARGQLYHAAALVAVAKTFDAAASEHGRIDRQLLLPADQALFDVVGATVAGVRSATERSKVAAAEIAPPAAGEKENPLMTRAADALKAADTLLAAAK